MAVGSLTPQRADSTHFVTSSPEVAAYFRRTGNGSSRLAQVQLISTTELRFDGDPKGLGSTQRKLLSIHHRHDGL